MSVDSDSLVHSSSSGDDFAAFLDEELEAASSETSPDDEQVNDDAEDEDDSHERRSKRYKTKEMGDVESVQVSTMAEMTEKIIGPARTHENNDICPPHPGFFKGLCMRCGQLEDDDGSGVAFGYIHKDLKLGSKEIERLRDVYPEEEYLLKEAHSSTGLSSIIAEMCILS